MASCTMAAEGPQLQGVWSPRWKRAVTSRASFES